MAADALAPCIARPSTIMAMAVQYKQASVFQKGFQLPLLSQC